MPFIQRTVEPKFLSRRPLDTSLSSPQRDDLVSVTNCTLVEALKQLASLVLYADEIFTELTAQVRVVQERSERLKNNIERVDDVVNKLNAKNVSVPVGDLKSYSRIKQHYVSHRPVQKNFFVSDTRPDTVRRLYSAAVVSPVCVMRQIDNYRNDGCRTSKYFLCLPFFKDAKVSFDVEIEMRRPASLCTARDWLSDDDIVEGIPEPKMLELCPIDDVSTSIDSEEVDAILRRLPSPEEKTYVMSLKFPYSDVPIDVTGSSFRRMSSLRRSFLQQVEYITKRKKKGKRRNTVTGTGGETMDNRDVEEALKEANNRKNNRLSAGTQTSPERCQSDGERSPSSSSSSSSRNGGVVVAFRDDVIVGRSFSEIGSKDRLNLSLRKKSRTKSKSEEKDVRSSSLESEKESSSSLPIGLKWFQRKSRNRNSIIGSLNIYEELERVKKSKRGFFGSLRSSPPPVEEAKSPSKSSTDSGVVRSITDNSGIMRSNRRAYIRGSHRSSLPVPILSNGTGIVTVKMRENSARGNSKGGGGGGEDGGQSSSGNWSASSSTRTSMESEDQQTRSTASPDLLNRTGSQTSLSKDSALSDRATPNEEFRWHDGYHSDVSAGTSSSVRKPNPFRFTRHSITKDTARWLRSLEEEGPNGRSVGETSSSGTITPRIHRRATSPLDVPLTFVDDGESSEFSVDTDGYYTSMHTDSGLRTLPIVRKQDDGSTLSKISDLNECGSSTTVSSMCSKDDGGSSESSKKETSITDGGGATSSDARNSPETKKAALKKVPPPPPPRRSTLSVARCREEVTAKPTSGFDREGSPANSVSSSESVSERQRKESTTSSSGPDSEPEQGEKFKLKTIINAGRIPSMCVVTPSPSDDEEADKEDTMATSRPHDVTTSSSFRTGRDTKLVEKLPSVPEERSNWSGSRSNFDDINRATTYQSLPRTFNRGASLNSHMTCEQFTNSWPRRPNQVVYKPETIKISSLSGQKVASTDVKTGILSPTGNTMMTFTQMATTNDFLKKRPNSIAIPHSISGSYLNRGFPSPTTPTCPRIPPSSSVICGSNSGNGGVRQGARVTLDAAGQVIHSTGSLPRPTSISSPNSLGPECNSLRNGPLSIQKGTALGGPIQKYSGSSINDSSPTTRQTQSSNSADNNTLPRRKPLQGERSVSAYRSDQTTNSNLLPSTYHVGTIPRRWNNFFHRREPQPLSSTPSPPEPLNSAKMGVYVRLDGHPIHLEPGTTAPSSPNKDPTSSLVTTSTVPPQPFVLRQQPLSPSTPTQQKPPQNLNHQVQTEPSFHQNLSQTTRIPVQTPPQTNNTSPLPLYYRPVNRTPGYARPNNLQNRSPISAPSSAPHLSRPVVAHQGSNLPVQYPTSIPSSQSYPVMPRSQTIVSVTKPPTNSSSTPPVSVGLMVQQQHPQPQHCYNGIPMNGRAISLNNGPPRSPQNWSNYNGPSTRPVGPFVVPSCGTVRQQQQPTYPMHSPLSHTGMQRAHITSGDPNCSGLPNPPQPPTNALPSGTYSLHPPQSPGGTPKPLSPSTNQTPSKVDGSPTKTKSTMSNEDLYALIHRSKKKLNIKTDPERSVSPSSSRSDSPSQQGPLNLKNNSYDGGSTVGLSNPRSRSPLCLPGDRRSWAGDRSLMSPSPTPSNGSVRSLPASSPGDRRSWASDRLGPNRPTSMHDFKLLLLQAGRTTPKEVSGGRRSAAEMLNASPCSQKSPVVPNMTTVTSPKTPIEIEPRSPPPPHQNQSDFTGHRPTPPRVNLYGNGRRHGLGRPMRSNCVSSLLHNRTDILSTPIFEDEGSEDSDESNSIKVTPLLPSPLRSNEITAT